MGNPIIEALHKALTNDPLQTIDGREELEIRAKVDLASYIELAEARQWLLEKCPKIITEGSRCPTLSTLLTVKPVRSEDHEKTEFHVEISQGGHLPSGLIRRVLFQNYPRLGDAFNKQLAHHPNLKGGRILIDFKIDREGNVKSIQLKPDKELAIPTMLDEMTIIILSIKFPKPLGGGDIKVSHPFFIQTDP